MKYSIKGKSLPVLSVKLDRNEAILSQAGAMSWHTDGISVETKGTGGIGKMIKRSFTGESMFQNTYKASRDDQEIAFASTFPGDIVAFDIKRERGLIVQKEAFLVSEVNIESDIYFQKRLGAGLFGGEGFVMLKLTGDGIAFLEVDGSAHKYELGTGEKMIVDTGHVVAMEDSCHLDIEKAGNIKSMIFGGEGAFNTVVHGPGTLYLQSMPLSKLKNLITADIEMKTNN